MYSVRYIAALIVVVVAPPCLLWWLLIHPLAILWRKLGWLSNGIVGILTYCLVFVLAAGTMRSLYKLRKDLLIIDFGTNYFIMTLSIIILAIGVVIYWKAKKQLTTGIQFGIPELLIYDYPSKLLTEWIYSKIRHPRYVASICAVLGYALLSNFKMSYIFAFFLEFGIYLIVIIEEKELRCRFGSDYEKYCQKVPRFLPKISQKHSLNSI